MRRFILTLVMIGLIASPAYADKWFNKPPVGSQIDWTHPLARGLVGCWLLNERGGKVTRELVTQENAVISGTGIKLVNYGIYSPNGETTDTVKMPSINPMWNNLIPVSVAFKHLSTNVSSYKTIFSKDQSDGGFLIKNTSDPEQIQLQRDYSTFDLKSTIALPYNIWTSFVITWTGSIKASGITWYTNGIYTTPIFTQNGNGTMSDDSSYKVCLGSRDSNDRNMNGSLEYVYLYNRVLSANEAWQLYIDPYCFIKRSYGLNYVAPAAPVVSFGGQVIWLD